MEKYYYLIKALKAFRITSYGQFDQETYHVVKETQDAAKAIEELIEENRLLKRKLEDKSNKESN